MALLKAARTIKAPFANEIEWYRVRYNFTNDGGATGALTIFTLSGAALIVHAHARVITAATSGGSATLIWGHNGDTDLFMTTTQGAVASLTANACILPLAIEGTPNALPIPVALADGATITQTIGTAALTAGVVEYCIGVMKV